MSIRHDYKFFEGTSFVVHGDYEKFLFVIFHKLKDEALNSIAFFAFNVNVQINKLNVHSLLLSVWNVFTVVGNEPRMDVNRIFRVAIMSLRPIRPRKNRKKEHPCGLSHNKLI
jgi:hypothetical protein